MEAPLLRPRGAPAPQAAHATTRRHSHASVLSDPALGEPRPPRDPPPNLHARTIGPSERASPKQTPNFYCRDVPTGTGGGRASEEASRDVGLRRTLVVHGREATRAACPRSRVIGERLPRPRKRSRGPVSCRSVHQRAEAPEPCDVWPRVWAATRRRPREVAGKTRAETFLSGSNLVFVPRAAAALYETHGTANRTEIIGKPLSMMRQHSPASLGVVTRRLGRFGSYPPWVPWSSVGETPHDHYLDSIFEI